MSLAGRLAAIPPERRAWVEEAGEGRYADLVDFGLRLPATESPPRVALRLRTVSSAIKTLCALDGHAASLVLLSASMDASVAAELVQTANCSLVITDVDPGPLLGNVPARRWETLQQGPPGPGGVATEWILSTSGTTAIPKLVRHTSASLTETLKGDPSRSADVRWGLLYDYTRFAGIHSLLQSLFSGATLIVPDMDWSLEAKVEFLARHGCTHLAGTPTLWRTLLMTPNFNLLSLRQVTMGGEVADDRLLSMLRDRLPEAKIRHIYGSNEAGVGFTVSDGRAGFPISYLEDAGRDVKLRIVDGRLYLRRAGFSTSYVGARDAIQESDGFTDTGDLVEVKGDRVYFLGRASGVINVGGNKVHPEAVEQILLEHPDVAMARVYAINNPISGALVMADVVPSTEGADPASLAQSVLQHCRARLSRYQQPVKVRVVDAIGTTIAGKVSRKS